MRPRIVKTIAVKELVESFRDRRTLFMMVFLPVLLYPLLLLLVTQVSVSQQNKLEAQRSVVAYAGAEPDHPFAAFLAEDEKLELVPVESAEHPLDPGNGGIDCLIDLGRWPELAGTSPAEIRIEFSSIEEASRQAQSRVEERLAEWIDAEVHQRIAQANLSLTLIEPVVTETVDRSRPAERGGYFLAAILPILVIVTVILGAFYPAIDLTAGEKERCSIQTLFVAPISALEIAAGKYLAVLGVALVSGLANLASMALVFSHNLWLGGQIGEALAGEIDFSISFPTLAVLLVIIVLVAVLVSALLLTVAVLARSFKEAQNYLTPVMLIFIVPAAVVQLPGFELTPALAMVPAINAMLLMKQVLIEGVVAELFFLVAASTLVYTALVLVMASKLFSQEEVILGERGDMAFLSRRARREQRARPSVGEGLVVYGLVMVLLFYVGSTIQAKSVFWGLIGTLWGVVLLPTLALTRHLKLDFVETFHLRRPSWRAMTASVILGASAWVPVALITTWIDQHLLKAPPEATREMVRMLSEVDQFGGWVGLVLLVAVSPALCEEALCRGFLFASLRQRLAPWAVILVSGLLFGMLHLSLYRLAGASMLGIIMGLLVFKSGSIWTSVIFHGLNNGMALFLLAIAPGILDNDARFPPWLTGVALAGTVLGLVVIARERSPWQGEDKRPVLAGSSVVHQ